MECHDLLAAEDEIKKGNLKDSIHDTINVLETYVVFDQNIAILMKSLHDNLNDINASQENLSADLRPC